MGFLRRPQNLKKSSSYFWQERRFLCAQQHTCQKVDEDFSKQTTYFSRQSALYFYCQIKQSLSGNTDTTGQTTKICFRVNLTVFYFTILRADICLVWIFELTLNSNPFEFWWTIITLLECASENEKKRTGKKSQLGLAGHQYLVSNFRHQSPSFFTPNNRVWIAPMTRN